MYNTRTYCEMFKLMPIFVLDIYLTIELCDYKGHARIFSILKKVKIIGKTVQNGNDYVGTANVVCFAIISKPNGNHTFLSRFW